MQTKGILENSRDEIEILTRPYKYSTMSIERGILLEDGDATLDTKKGEGLEDLLP